MTDEAPAAAPVPAPAAPSLPPFVSEGIEKVKAALADMPHRVQPAFDDVLRAIEVALQHVHDKIEAHLAPTDPPAGS